MAFSFHGRLHHGLGELNTAPACLSFVTNTASSGAPDPSLIRRLLSSTINKAHHFLFVLPLPDRIPRAARTPDTRHPHPHTHIGRLLCKPSATLPLTDQGPNSRGQEDRGPRVSCHIPGVPSPPSPSYSLSPRSLGPLTSPSNHDRIARISSPKRQASCSGVRNGHQPRPPGSPRQSLRCQLPLLPASRYPHAPPFSRPKIQRAPVAPAVRRVEGCEGGCDTSGSILLLLLLHRSRDD